jgi:hypothetical protein
MGYCLAGLVSLTLLTIVLQGGDPRLLEIFFKVRAEDIFLLHVCMIGVMAVASARPPPSFSCGGSAAASSHLDG